MKYQYMALIGLLLSAMLLFLPKKIKANLILMGFSSLIGLYLLETLLAIIPISIKYIHSDYQYDFRSRDQVIRELNREGDVWRPQLTPILLLNGPLTNSLIPLAGISNSKTVYCNENGEYITYLSDRYGFNNPDENWARENGGIVLIGDSMAHGACVNPESNIAGNLSNLLNKTIINLGMPGNGPTLALGTLKEYGPIQNPDYVFWLFFEGNDLVSDLPQEKNTEVISRYIENDYSQNLSNKQELIDNFWIENIEKPNFLSSELIRNLKLPRLRYLINIDRGSPIDIDFYREVLIEGKRYSESLGSKIIFVYLPEYQRYVNESYHNEKYIIRDLVEELGITFIDIDEELFEPKENPLSFFPFEYPGHYNEAGYKKISVVIENKIEEIEGGK